MSVSRRARSSTRPRMGRSPSIRLALVLVLAMLASLLGGKWSG